MTSLPIISKIGRKYPKTRVLIGLIYLTLIAGSFAMIYPFGVMLSGSFKSPVDMHEYDVIPRYWYDDAVLFQKYVEERYNQSESWMNSTWKTQFNRFEDVLPPAVYSEALLKDWLAFLESDDWHDVFPGTDGRLPLSWFQLAAFYSPSFRKPWLYQRWLGMLSAQFHGDIEALNGEWGLNFGHFYMILPPAEIWTNRRYVPEENPICNHMVQTKQELRRNEPHFLLPLSADAQFLSTYIWPKYSRDIEQYNATHGTTYRSYAEVILDERAPSLPLDRREWIAYAADDWRVRNIRFQPSAQDAFRNFLMKKYGSAENAANVYRVEPDAFARFRPSEPITSDTQTPVLSDFREFLFSEDFDGGLTLQTVEDWSEYVRNEIHLQFIRITENGIGAFRDYLVSTYLSTADGDEAKALDLFRQKYGITVTPPVSSLRAAVTSLSIPQPVPLKTPLARDFNSFIMEVCPLSEIRLVTPDTLFARYLEKKYQTVEELERAVCASVTYPMGTREELVAQLTPFGKTALAILEEYGRSEPTELFQIVENDLKKRDAEVPHPTLLDRLGLDSLEHIREAFLKNDRMLISWIRQIDAFSERKNQTFRDYPNQEYARDWLDLQQNKSAIRWEFLVSNYRVVLNFILFHGRALYNTVFFVVAMIVCTLVVNPLAAYALSRFQLPSTYKVLLFFMATMAFPPEVTMIPGFLLLKNFPLGYLLVGAVFASILLFASYKVMPLAPRLWNLVEGCIVAGAALGALRHAATQFGAFSLEVSVKPETLRALLLTVLALGIFVLWGIARLGAKNTRLRISPVGVAATGAALLGILVTPALVRMIGFSSPKVSLLNTFWALILPSIANGYAIFLLKGFFDSLPQNLYESAEIEGAKELWMFRNVTLPLSKPILAVIALQTFNIAYTTFMYAFIVCQDPKMWTLMVWLYDMQFDSPQYVIFAGLVVAAIPTLLVFILTQRVIMRGIIIPVQK